MTRLLIVESPGKLKTLRGILGRGWVIEASVGHVTELAQDGPRRLGFALNAGGSGRVETRYVPRGPRGKQVLARLRRAARMADEVYLATDPDREGEAIAWHLAQELRLGRFARVTYTQLTENAVRSAIARPRGLDMPLVHAQRARQCLDKLVGFEVSPLLWDSTGGRSAGRVQSAALHRICERERERLAFRPEDYWILRARYAEGFEAAYEPESGIERREGAPENGRLRSEAEARAILEAASALPHIVARIEEREERRSPPPPLITSTLQQMAGARFRYPPRKTMQLAQELYEGVAGKGLITYMRTDAVALSPEFVQESRSWLQAHAPEAMADRAPVFRVHADAQGAHEAIRPTSASLTPEQARSLLGREQLDIYALIWQRAMASQCRPARMARTQAEILSGRTRWVAREMRVTEAGYLRFWKNIEQEHELPALREGQRLTLSGIRMERKATEPPSRYSEPKLVQLMERLGIGRPSTYASTLATLKEREYVTIEKSLLAPTALGLATDEALQLALPDLIDARFTARMEEALDRIASGELCWERYLCEWNDVYLTPALALARKALAGVRRVAVERVEGRAKGSAGGKPRGRRRASSSTSRKSRS